MWLTACVLGCGMAAAPQPPSLHLPKPVTDLKAKRIGNQVVLTWTMPKHTTDNQRLPLLVPVRVCRQTSSRVCDTVGTLQAAPEIPAKYIDELPAALTHGPLQSMMYQVFALNEHGRAASASNDAATLAGTAPPPVTDVTASVVSQGVILHWQATPSLPDGTFFQIERTLVTPLAKIDSLGMKPTSRPSHAAPTAGKSTKKQPATPEVQTLLVHPKAVSSDTSSTNTLVDPGMALDTSIDWNATYRYTVARVVARSAATAKIELQGQPSLPVTVTTKDVFPPAVPQRLVAVVVPAATSGASAVVDLSWSANAEQDFSQYRVYRRNLGTSASAVMIAPVPGSPASTAVVTPAYRDSSVQPGANYAYSVSAIDTSGNESHRSQEVIVDIPAN